MDDYGQTARWIAECPRHATSGPRSLPPAHSTVTRLRDGVDDATHEDCRLRGRRHVSILDVGQLLVLVRWRLKALLEDTMTVERLRCGGWRNGADGNPHTWDVVVRPFERT